jgi:hypothetical protein
MSERAYTVREIDDLRRVCEERYLFGSCAPTSAGRSSMAFREEEKIVAVEQMVRTHMIAGHVAQDLINADIEKESERKRKRDEIIRSDTQSR